MKKLLLLFSFAFSILYAGAQSCSENTSVNGIAGTGFTNGTIAQSFTACESGLLASVSAQSGNSATGFNQVVVEIFNGDGVTGTKLLTTGAVQVNSNRTVTWSLSSFNLQVIAGQKYTARFTTQRGSPQLKYGTGQNSGIDYYSRGRIYYLGNSWNDMFFSASIQTLGNSTLIPADDAIDVARSTEVKLDFSRSMEAVSGDITIENVTDASSEIVDVTTLTINADEVLMPLSTPLLPGKEYSIIIPSGVLRATNGIPFNGLASGDWTFTTSTKPFATLSTTSPDLTSESSVPFAIEFSDVVTGFDLGDVVITNGVASNLSGADASFTFDVTPSADGEVVVSLPADVVEAGTSNGNDSTGYSLIYDGTAPSVALSTDVVGTTETAVFDVDVVFSEPVTGFESSDLVITNAVVLSNTNTNDSLFTISLRALGEGQITVDVPSSIADDLAGNTNTAAPAIIDITFSVDLEEGLLSYYPFDGNANDTVSTGFNGTVTGATLTKGFDGIADGAYSFDGGDQIVFGDTPIGAGSFTLAFWVKIPEGIAQNQSRTILGKRAACTEGRLFEINYTNSSTNGHQISVEQRNNVGVSSPVAILSSVGEWMHIAYVKDNEQTQSSFYVNGDQQTPVGWSSTYNFENNGNLRAGISACDGNGRVKFNGDMDDLYIYDRALSAAEIDLLAPFIIQGLSADSGSSIQAGENIEVSFNKNLIGSSVSTANITASGSVSGSLDINITFTADKVVIAPAGGWPLDEDVTISLSNILATNGTTLPTTDLTYSVIADEEVGLILYYPISQNANEAIGDIADQDGTISGALLTEGFDGDPFGALSFDGGDDLVTLGDAPISTESFSISLWMKVPADGSTTANTIILSKRDACTEGRMINLYYLRSGDKYRVIAGLRDNAPAGSVSTGFDFPVDEWVNVAFVKDNATSKYRLIMNGVLEAEGNWSLGSVNIENSAPLRLGATPCNGANGELRFDGLMDDIRIYDRALKPSVLSVAPVRGTVGAAIDTVITVTFSKAVDVSSFEASTVAINDSDETSYSYTTAFSNGDSVLTITPDSNYLKGKTFTVSIDTLSALIGADFLPFQTSFTTVSSRLLSHFPLNGVSDVDSLETISFKFDNSIDMESLNQGIQVIGSMHGPVEGSFTMPTTDSVVFTPTRPYFPNEIVTVYVTPSLSDGGGESISNNKAFTFHAAAPQFVNPTLSFELSKLTTPMGTTSPRDLVAADLDNDGDLDLVGGEENPGTLYWFENKGFGNYGEGQIIDSNNDYWDIEVTDFDFDGDLDLVTASRVTGKGVYWYENDGAASFTENLIVSLPSNADLRAIKAADFNGDGSMDVVTADFGQNRLTVYDKDGTSLFAAANVGGPLDVQVADRDNDGDLDLFLANYTSGNVASFTNSGSATFGGSVMHSASFMRAVIPIDFDKDGDIDVVYSAQSASQIGILENNGDFTYTNHVVGSVGGPHRIDVGDIEGDGDFDIIFTNASGASEINFYYLENSGSFQLWVPRKLIDSETFSGASSQTAKFADVDNDGDLDVIATDAGTGFYIFENKIIDLNNGPILDNPIADQTLAEDDSNGLTIDLSNVFSDAEGDAITLTVSSDITDVVVTLDGTDLNITSAANYFGTANITVTADDGNGVNTDAFVMNITSVNDEPAFTLSENSFILDEDFTTTETITVTQNQPANEDAPTYFITLSNPTLATVTIDANTGDISITALENAFGEGTFTVNANDGAASNNTFQQQFTLTVNSVNDAPTLENPLSDFTFDEDATSIPSVNLSGAFADEDVSLTYEVNLLEGSDLINSVLNEASIDITAIANAFGVVEMEVIATDEQGAVAKDTLEITINSINDAPNFTTSGDLTLVKDFTSTENVTVIADATPFGEENQVITYTLSPTTVSFANVTLDQSTGEVTITSIVGEFGTQEFTITADDGQAESNTATQTFTLAVVDLLPQAVTFTGVEDKTFGDADFIISASVDSGLPVVFTVLSGGISIVTGGKKVGVATASTQSTFTITGAGLATIQVANDGDETYAPFSEVLTISVAKADQILSIDQITTKSVAASPIVINASVNTGLSLDYAISGPATIAGNTITLSGTAGTVSATVSQAGNDNYNMVSEIVTFEVVEKQSQTITFTDIPDLIYGVTDQTLSATSSSSLVVTYSLVSGPATLDGSTLTITGVGTVVVEANQAGDDDFLPGSVQQSIIVSKADLTITADNKTITYGDAVPELTFVYSGFVNGESEADLDAEAVVVISSKQVGEGSLGAGTYNITVSGAQSANYEFTFVNAILTVEKADQVITLDPIAEKKPMDAAFDVVASVDSNLDLTYAITGPASIIGTTITLDGSQGTVTVTATQGGDINYNAASAETSFEVKLVLGAQQFANTIELYPNPVVNELRIEAEDIISVKVYGMSGKLILSFSGSTKSIDLSELESGVYLVEIQTNSEMFTDRIIKK